MARKSLICQVTEKFQSMNGIGRSRHNDKKTKMDKFFIYSFVTMKAYIDHACKAVLWIKDYAQEVDGVNIKWLHQAQQYIPAYILHLQSRPLRPTTIQTYLAGLSKLFGVSQSDWGVKLDSVYREDIKNNRSPNTVRSRHFSLKNNEELINFARCTGLRNDKELSNVSVKNLDKDKMGLIVVGKGGRERFNTSDKLHKRSHLPQSEFLRVFHTHIQ